MDIWWFPGVVPAGPMETPEGKWVAVLRAGRLTLNSAL